MYNKPFKYSKFMFYFIRVVNIVKNFDLKSF